MYLLNLTELWKYETKRKREGLHISNPTGKLLLTTAINCKFWWKRNHLGKPTQIKKDLWQLLSFPECAILLSHSSQKGKMYPVFLKSYKLSSLDIFNFDFIPCCSCLLVWGFFAFLKISTYVLWNIADRTWV